MIRRDRIAASDGLFPPDVFDQALRRRMRIAPSGESGMFRLGRSAGGALELSMWTIIKTGISADGRDGQPAEIMRPTSIVAGALLRVRKTTMGHAQQGAAIPVDEVDLDQARSRWYHFAPLPTEAVSKTVHRHEQRCARWLLMASARIRSDTMPMTPDPLGSIA
jgi:hypothetical protein